MDVVRLREAYIKFVGSDDYCISEEAARYLYNFIKEKKIKDVVDMGSGLSTAIFASVGVRTFTYDNDLNFLRKTLDFCSKQDLSCELYSGNKADLVFYDLGDLKTRKEYILTPFEVAKKYVIYDDLDNKQYTEILDKEGIEYKIIPSTMDARGRFLGIVEL